MFSGGGIRRALVGVAMAAAAMAGAGATVRQQVDSGPRRNAHHSDRNDIYLGRWSYARKGERTAAQIQRAARKKRNRKRNK